MNFMEIKDKQDIIEWLEQEKVQAEGKIKWITDALRVINKDTKGKKNDKI